MITLQRITTNEQMYRWAMEQLKEAFPAEERRDDDLQKTVMQHPDYRLCAIYIDETPVGVVGFWLTAEFLYFENFCVQSNFRNKGIGSATLQHLVQTYCSGAVTEHAAVNASVNASACNCRQFILEAELPTDDITRRRIAFYKRNGMVENKFHHIQPHYRTTDPDLPLVILTYGAPLTDQQYAHFRTYLDKNVDVR